MPVLCLLCPILCFFLSTAPFLLLNWFVLSPALWPHFDYSVAPFSLLCGPFSTPLCPRFYCSLAPFRLLSGPVSTALWPPAALLCALSCLSLLNSSCLTLL